MARPRQCTARPGWPSPRPAIDGQIIMSEVTAGSANAAATTESHDVCVIGSGPAGAFVAHELVAAGARVVLVEAGEAVTPGTSSHLSPSAFKHRGSWQERQ